MSVAAMFYVREVTRYAYQSPGYAQPAPQVSVVLNPVSGAKGDHNKEWASATPSGEIKLTVGNPTAAGWFDSMLGKDVFITFTERESDDE